MEYSRTKMLFINKNHGEWVRIRHNSGDDIFLTAVELPKVKRGATFYFKDTNKAFLLENPDKYDWEIQEQRRLIHEPSGEEISMKLITSRFKEGVYVLGIENPTKSFDFVYRFCGIGIWPDDIKPGRDHQHGFMKYGANRQYVADD
jgi:hypothetical protein